jgi:flagellar basal-body rod protein FlgG
MIRSLYTAGSGMIAQQTAIDTIANNLANVNTNGYKKQRAEFQEALYAFIPPALPTGAPRGIHIGQGVQLAGINRLFDGGPIVATGNEYDLAIQGEGFFRVQLSDGTTAYTRDGAFRLDGERRLTTATGALLVDDQGRPVQIPEGALSVRIGPDGQLTYTQRDEAGASVEVPGQKIGLYTFPNPSGLLALGDNLLTTSANSGDALQAGGTIQQGALEGSNVQMVEEMVALIQAQRAYEFSSKAIQTSDEMLSLANNLRKG